MKTKNYLLSGLLSVLVIAGIYGFTNTKKANDAGDGLVSMRVSEQYSPMGGDKSITIVYPDGKEESIDLERTKSSDVGRNLKKINEVLNKIKSKGYKLITASSSNFGDAGFIVDYTFEKE